MRALFTVHPGISHFFMQEPLIRAFIAAGHEVRVASSASFVPEIDKRGVCALPVGVDWLVADPGRTFPSYQWNWTPDNFSLEDIFLGPSALATARDVLQLSRSWMPEVIIRDQWDFGGAMAAEILGLVHVSAGLNVFVSPADYQILGAGHFSANREALGLPPDPDLSMIYRHLDVAIQGPSFRRARDFVSPKTRFFRPPPPASTPALPSWFARLPDRPNVHVTFGTVLKQVDTYRTVIAALAASDVNVLVACGQLDPSALGALPANTIVERWLPHATLLPQCAVVVTHGGINTIVSTVSNGKPLLVLPHGGDQIRNAEMCAEMGVGLSLLADAVTPESVLGAARALLSQSSFTSRAEAAREELRALPLIDVAVPLITDLVASRRSGGP